MKEKHSPGPFIALYHDDRKTWVVGCSTTDVPVATITNRRDKDLEAANAAFVVRACNSYAVMRDTLHKIRVQLELGHYLNDPEMQAVMLASVVKALEGGAS